MLTREQMLEAVALAGRAPSPHNIQPARWRFQGDAVELWEEPERWLAVGDPSGRDNQIALGMALEGMAIALGRYGMSIVGPDRESPVYPPAGPQRRLVARGHIAQGASTDALLSELGRRSCWRGSFDAPDAAQLAALDACIARHAGVAMLIPDALRGNVAGWYDAASAEGLDDPAFAEELYHWMRFSRGEQRWDRDGLAADCLVLSGVEAWGASIALRPAVVRILAALSLTGLLVSEAGKVRSAARLVAIHAPAGEAPFDSGRNWYRFWLALSEEGFAGVPMSALSDSPAASAKLLDAAPLPAGRTLLNVMRIGPAPRSMPRSARLPAAELLLQ